MAVDSRGTNIDAKRKDGSRAKGQRHPPEIKTASEGIILKYPDEMESGKDHPWIRYEVYEFEATAQPGKINSGFQNKAIKTKVKNVIALPMDQQLAMTDAQKWTAGEDLATIFERLGGGKFLSDLADSFGNTVAKTLSKGTQEGENLIDKVALKYEGPEQRTFTLTHTMIPKSAKEEKTIKDIIMTFRHAGAPNREQRDNAKATSYKYPELFKITWMLGAKENDTIPHYDISYLTSIAVTYGDDNFSRFESGAPTVYEMTLSFTEMEFINKTHIAVHNF